jgi:hypothetical protein
MTEQLSSNKPTKRKGFVARLIEKLDKKLEEKARQQPCCARSKDEQKSSCC